MTYIVTKPLKEKLNENAITLGEKIRNKRLELRLLQKDIAGIIGVSEDTITYWENNRSKPSIIHFPRIIQYLGYIPFDFEEGTLGAKIKRYRYLHGISQEDLSRQIGVNESTVFHYENNRYKPSKKTLKKLEMLLAFT
jgi:transcriptional regulator with XRE-family HTH domain